MTKVIDLYLDLPPTEEHIVEFLSDYILTLDGFEGYKYTFGEKMANEIGLTMDELDKVYEEQGEKVLKNTIKEAARKVVIPLPNFVEQLSDIGVDWGVISTHDRDNEKTAEIVSQFPDKFLGFAYIDPSKGMDGVRELEYAVKELKLSALYITSFRIGMTANDRRCYPLYAKAAELGIPVFIYSGMNLAGSIPMDIGHPKYIDDVASDFPELKIMVTVGGWPWVQELVGLALRHPNVYINTEVQSPKGFTIPNRGYEPLVAWGSRRLQDKICFASNWQVQGRSLETLIDQVLDLPLEDNVKEKWLYKNAAKFFGRE